MVGIARPFVKWFYPYKPLDLRNPKIQQIYLNSLNWYTDNPSIDFSDPRVVAEIKQIRLSIPALHELAQLLAICRASLEKVYCPMLVIQSKRDKTVNPACASELMKLAVNAQPRTLRWLEESDHVITLGPEREEVFVLSREFIDSPLATPPVWDAQGATSSSDQAGA
ncbi:MAG TPA: hypothetical protein VIZ18_17990, partial [Ktedonobacteraceae bacterium]